MSKAINRAQRQVGEDLNFAFITADILIHRSALSDLSIGVLQTGTPIVSPTDRAKEWVSLKLQEWRKAAQVEEVLLVGSWPLPRNIKFGKLIKYIYQQFFHVDFVLFKDKCIQGEVNWLFISINNLDLLTCFVWLRNAWRCHFVVSHSH